MLAKEPRRVPAAATVKFAGLQRALRLLRVLLNSGIEILSMASI